MSRKHVNVINMWRVRLIEDTCINIHNEEKQMQLHTKCIHYFADLRLDEIISKHFWTWKPAWTGIWAKNRLFQYLLIFGAINCDLSLR